VTSRPEITYFDIRGRAEPIRRLLEEVGVEYDDVQIASEQWPARKSRLPFGQLPMFREGDLEVVQSHAIYRHLARRHGLAGEDEAQRLRCDVAVEAIRDIDEFVGSLLWRPDFEAQREAIVKNELPPRLRALSRFFGDGAGQPDHWAGESLTLADIFAFAFLEDLEALFPGSLVLCENLAAFRARFAERPRIAAYLDSARRPAAIMYGPVGKIHPVGTGGGA
jgi:glutathione S-transferase